MWTLPNILTYLRIAFIPVIFYMLMQYENNPIMATRYAFVLFIALAITDYFDGMLARKFNQQSEIGRFLDPIADKLLIVACLFAMAQTKFLGWMETSAATVIILREIFVSGLRDYISGYDVKIHVTKLAKYKTALQMIATAVLILGYPFGKLTIKYAMINVYETVYTFGQSLIIMAAFISVITALDYWSTAIKLMKNK